MRTSMTDCDREAIAEAPDRTLAEWWCLLNKWEWPRAGLGEPDPIHEKREGISRRGQIMNAIFGRIGPRECLREWNRDTMPGAAFDEWWASRLAARMQATRPIDAADAARVLACARERMRNE